MSRNLHRYPLDPSGSAASNTVTNEVRTLERRAKRALVPTYGAFFAESLRIRDKDTNALLERGTHYVLSRLYAEPSTQFGKEVYAIIIIVDPSVADTVTLDYQAVGGDYESLLPIILELIDTVKKDDRPIDFNAIDGRPAVYPPVRHLHDIGDMYGFEPLVHAVERARMAMEMSKVLDYDNYYLYADNLVAALAGLGSLLASAAVAQHNGDPNAHGLYMLRSKIDSYATIVRRPFLVSPINASLNNPLTPLLQLGKYYCMYRNPQKAVQFQLSKRSDFATIDFDVTLEAVTDRYQMVNPLSVGTIYYWRGRYQADDLSWSQWSAVRFFSTRAS